MTDRAPKFAGIATRVLYIAILTAVLVVGGFVFLENTELHKLIAPTPFVRIGVLLGQCLALVSANYFLAIKGNNFTDAKTELLLVLAAGFTCVSVLGPYMFLRQVGVSTAPWWKPWHSDSPVFVPESLFLFGLIPAGLFFTSACIRIYWHSRVRDDSDTNSETSDIGT